MCTSNESNQISEGELAIHVTSAACHSIHAGLVKDWGRRAATGAFRHNVVPESRMVLATLGLRRDLPLSSLASSVASCHVKRLVTSRDC